MRLTQLDLLCYGAFENRPLALRPDAKLHVVYGANEAGKSTTLAAVQDFLFGFGARTRQDFRFRQSDLRIGGELLARNGGRLAFVRRKGAKNTLLDRDQKPVADDALIPFLGQMTREIFSGAFGLDAECLRKGADELLRARGEVGSSLMAAASGLRGLATLRKQLDEQAEGLFTANKSQSRRFYQARDRYEAAREIIKASELRADAWKKLNAAVAEHAAAVKALEDELRDIRMERARLVRLKSLAPILRAIDAQQALLFAQGDAPEAPAGFADELDAGIERSRLSSQAVARAAFERDESAAALAAIEIDVTLIDRADEIEMLLRGVDKQIKNNVDLPRVAAERDAAQAELDRHARKLGLASSAALEAAQPGEPTLALVRELAAEDQELTARRSDLALTLRSEQEGLEALDAERARLAAVQDPAPLLAQLAALGSVEALVAARDQKALALRREEETLRREASMLAPPVDDLAALVAAAPPSVETIASFALRFESAVDAERDVSRRVSETDVELQDVKRRLEGLFARGEAPTPERIAQARAARDDSWAPLRATLFGEPEALTGAALAAGALRFEVAQQRADALADDAVRDAARVADYATLSATLDRQSHKAAALQEERSSCARARADLDAEWAALWAPVGVSPRAPSDMRAWRTSVDNLCARQAQLAEARLDVAAADAELARVAVPLARIAAEAGLPAMEIDVARQSRRVAARLAELATAWDEARGMARRRADILARIDKLTRDLAQVDERRDVWSRQWRSAAPEVGLPADATAAQARAAIDVWRLAPQMIEKREALAHRVKGIQRDIGDFDRDARALIDSVAPDLAALPLASGVTQLSKRLEQARREATRGEEATKRKRASEDALRRAQRDAEHADRALDALTAALPEGEEPASYARRLREREQVRRDLADWRARFADQAEGLSEDALRADLSACDPDRIAADVEALAEREERQTNAWRDRYAMLKDAERDVAAHGVGTGSEAAWQLRMNAEAEMQAAAREWLVLRLASAMLGEALERHRASQQDPLMQRASAIFASLTGGGFAGVAQDFDESDAAVLLGRRADGARVPVDGLSEGTRDQLYLALRLAYVEDYAARAEPAPFIADDLFTSFDDARTAFGLRALAETGARTQCILFTHHRHVVDLALAEVGSDADVVAL